MNPSTTTKELVLSLRDKSKNYIRQSLAFWNDVGYDKKINAYYEATDLEGRPLTELNRRFRIHPRNIFAHTAGTVAGYGDYLSTAEAVYSFIMKNCWQEGQGFATLSNSEGSIVNPRVLTYDHAFVLLCLSWLHRASGKQNYKEQYRHVWELMKKRLSHGEHGFLSGLPPLDSEAPMLQNPHMHLFEALMEIYTHSQEEYWLAEAQKIYHLFRDSFYVQESGTVIEHFNADLTPRAGSENQLEPGHHFEWVWLLHKYQNLSHEETVPIKSLYTFAVNKGLSKDLLPYEVCDLNGHPVKSTQRMWGQTEQIKAALAMYEQENQLVYLSHACTALDNLFSHFCIPGLAGVWKDCHDKDGNVVSDTSPSSTLYHLYIALEEFIRVSNVFLQGASAN